MEQSKNKKLFYGWIITMLAGLTYFGSNGLLSSSSGIIIGQLLLVKGWDATQVSLTYTIKSFVGFGLPIVGLALRKWGARKCIFWTTLVTAIFLAATGWVNTPVAFIIVYGIAVSVAMNFNDQLACFAAINPWWDRRRGEHGGYVQAMGALGGVVFPSIVTALFMNFSWKSSLIIMAIALMVITAIPQMIWMKDKPADLGLEPDGGSALEKAKKPGKVRKAYDGYRSPVNWDVRDAIRTPQVWFIGLAWGAITFGYCAVMYFGFTHMVINGWSEMGATSCISLLSLFILAGSLLLSPLTDRLNPRISFFLIGFICGLGYLLFDVAVKSNSMVLLVISMILAGMPDGPVISAAMVALTSYYGPKNYPAIQPYCNIVLTIICSFSSLICGAVFAAFGSFTNAYYISAAFSIVVSFASLTLRPPKVSEKLLAKYAARESTGTAAE